MTLPVINAVINFSTGAGFASPMIIDSGIIGINTLSDAAAAPVIVDVSSVVNSIKTTRGRTANADNFQTGSMSLRIIDQNGDFNPMNPASPYYNLLTPMRKVVISASYGTKTYPIFAGYITSYSTSTPKDVGDVVYTTIQAVDGFRLAANTQITTVTGAVAGETTGTRIGRILDMIAWPSGMRDLDLGQTTVQIDPGTARTGLAAMQTIESTEYGALYIDGAGNFVFQDRALTSSSVGGTTTDFNDNGTDIGYSNALWKLDDTLVFNKATISMVGGTPQVATNQASIDKYFLHSYNEQNLMMQTDAEALNNAKAYVASRAETAIRCDAITLDLYTDNYDAGITAALALDYFDPISVTTTQPGSSTLSKTLQVFGVSHDVTPNTWKTTFTTLEPIIDSFIIGNAFYGVLGTSVLSY
jgi:hypothetical protein